MRRQDKEEYPLKKHDEKRRRLQKCLMKISAVTAALLLLFLTGACSREPSGQTETGSRAGQEAGSEAIQETGSESGLTAGPEAVEETIPEAGQ